jgi:hypothetical protein
MENLGPVKDDDPCPELVLQPDFLTKKRGHNFTKQKGGHEIISHPLVHWWLNK